MTTFHLCSTFLYLASIFTFVSLCMIFLLLIECFSDFKYIWRYFLPFKFFHFVFTDPPICSFSCLFLIQSFSRSLDILWLCDWNGSIFIFFIIFCIQIVSSHFSRSHFIFTHRRRQTQTHPWIPSKGLENILSFVFRYPRTFSLLHAPHFSLLEVVGIIGHKIKYNCSTTVTAIPLVMIECLFGRREVKGH